MKKVCFELDIQNAKKELNKGLNLHNSVDNQILKSFDKFIKRKSYKLTPCFTYYGKIFAKNRVYRHNLDQLLKVVANMCKKDIKKYNHYIVDISL